jgi:hypothetical protein
MPRPIRRVLYKLPIRFQVLPGDSRNSLDQEDILDAYEMCVAPNVWQPFLQLSMESSWIKAANKDVDPECGEFRIVHLQTAIKTKCIGVALLKAAERGVYEGSKRSWSGTSAASCRIPTSRIQMVDGLPTLRLEACYRSDLINLMPRLRPFLIRH